MASACACAYMSACATGAMATGATAIAITVNSVAASFFISYVLCSKRSDPTSSSGRLQIGARTFLFVDLLRIGRVLDELVVAPWAFVASSCADCLFPKRIHGVNSWCSTAVSVSTCSGDRAPSGIRSSPAWAFPSWPPSSRTGGRPRLWSWSLPRCACASCCTGVGGSRLPPIANKQHCSTQPSTSWTPPNISSSSEKDPPRAAIEPPVGHPRTGRLARQFRCGCPTALWMPVPMGGGACRGCS